MTMNSPESLTLLYEQAAPPSSTDAEAQAQVEAQAIATAELIREVGLKCISFNGIPRTINSLNAFKASLPPSVAAGLSRVPTREPDVANIDQIRARGRALWDSIYRPFETKLYEKLADAHPDLPVHILNANYGALLSDPEGRGATGAGVAGAVGRVLTSVVAVACLRAQAGVGPQVTSHVFGLRKAVEDGSWVRDVESEEGARWLASDEGNEWILNSVDRIIESISEGQGSNFAPPSAKL